MGGKKKKKKEVTNRSFMNIYIRACEPQKVKKEGYKPQTRKRIVS